MTAHEEPHIDSSGPAIALVEPIPFALLDKPLEYIFVDRCRHRSLCAAMRRFSSSGYVARSEADMVIGYLGRDLDLHHRDEDESLFPALRRRAMPEDDLGISLARLAEDHRQGQPMVESIIDALAARPGEDPVKLAQATRELMLAYAAGEHRHLAIENGIVMAIARIRLTRGDLRTMSRAMKERRGVSI